METAEPADLGPGPRTGVESAPALEAQLRPLLRASELEKERQDLVLALVLLWHDHLDEAHSIAQSVESPDGSFIHGIMHRREADFGNAAYWFRRVGRHPAFEPLGRRVAALSETTAEKRITNRLVAKGDWDPFAFIDACAAAEAGDNDAQKVLRKIQQEEFNTLLLSLQGR